MDQLPFLSGNTLISCSLGALRSVHGRKQRKGTLFLMSFDRHESHLVPCKISRFVMYLGFEEQGYSFTKKIGVQNR